MNPPSEQELKEFMTSLGFEWLSDETQWYKVLPHKVGNFQGKGRGQYVHPELATFMYQITRQAGAEARTIGMAERLANYLDNLDATEAVHLLAVTAYLYVLQPTNAESFESTMHGFNRKGEVLGDMTISFKLNQKGAINE